MEGSKPEVGPSAQLESVLSDLSYRQVLDHVREPVAIDDVDGRIVYANAAFLELFRYTTEEVHRMRVHELVAARSLLDVRAIHERRVRGEPAPTVFEFYGKRRDGFEILLEISVLALRENGQLVGSQSIMRDISARRQTEQRLERTEQTLDELLRTVPLAVCVLDGSGAVSKCNAHCEALLGWSASELVGAPLPLADTAALEAGDASDIGVRRKDGSVAQVELFASHDPGHSGSVVVLIDVQARREAENDYRVLFRHAQDGIVIFDPDTENVLEVNPRYCELHGFTRDELVGTSLRAISVDVERGNAAVREAIERGSCSFATTHYRKDGSKVHLESAATRVMYGGRPAIMGLARDVTARRRLEAELQNAQKLEAIAVMTGGIAHDFNNILVNIMASAELLLLGDTEADEQDQLIGEIGAAAERGRALTQQLLAFGRKQVVAPRELSLDGLVMKMARWLERVLEQAVRVEYAMAAGDASILADPVQLERILINLAANARDAMPDGGVWRLASETVTAEIGGELCERGLPAGQYVVLHVQDTGVGMDETTLQSIFTPFYTTKEAGTGLGLASVHGIVHQLGGTVTVVSSVGAGACFSLYFPRYGTCARAISSAPPSRAQSGTETLLLVEDDPAVQRSTRRILKRCGYQVIVASSGAEALELSNEGRLATVAAVVTDVMMPNMGGPELAAELRVRHPHLGILFISGYTSNDDWSDAALGQLLHKPFSIAELSESLRHAIDARHGERPDSRARPGPGSRTRPRPNSHARPIGAQDESNVLISADLSKASRRPS